MRLFFFKFRPFLFTLLLTYFLVITLGPMAMVVDESGNMLPCPFMGGAAICQMGSFEYLGIFQGILTSIPHKIIALLLTLISFLIVTIISGKRLFDFQRKGHPLSRPHWSYQLGSIFFSPLKYAFAKGILHPKIYELAYL